MCQLIGVVESKLHPRRSWGEGEHVGEDAVLGQRVQPGNIANTESIEQQRPRVPSGLAGTNRG